jgi:glycosyltransferase involved in cell wall biosynthesis
MKILILNWRDIKNPRAGGSELYFHEIAKKWVAKGHNVYWIAGKWNNCLKKEIVDGIKVIRTGNKISLYLLAPIKYFKLGEKPDIIIDVENGFPFFSPFFSRKKVILHIHHVHKDVWPKEFNFPISTLGNILESKIMPRVYKHNPIITLSKSSQEEIMKEYSRKSQIVNPGTNFYKRKKILKSKTPLILFVNRIKKYKGLFTLIQAIEKLNSEGLKLDLMVGGKGDYLPKIKRYVKEKGLKNIHFLGYINEGEKQELMQKAWIFINPSSKEGWGIVNIEANYFSTPVIGSNIGGIKDSVVDGETGFLFERNNPEELAKKIKKLLKDNKLRKKMESNSVRWAERFTWERASDEYLKELEKVLQ